MVRYNALFKLALCLLVNLLLISCDIGGGSEYTSILGIKYTCVQQVYFFPSFSHVHYPPTNVTRFIAVALAAML